MERNTKRRGASWGAPKNSQFFPELPVTRKNPHPHPSVSKALSTHFCSFMGMFKALGSSAGFCFLLLSSPFNFYYYCQLLSWTALTVHSRMASGLD